MNKVIIFSILIVTFFCFRANGQESDVAKIDESEKVIIFLPSVTKVDNRIRIEFFSKEKDLTPDFYKNYKVFSNDQEVNITFPQKVFLDTNFIKNSLPSEIASVELINRDTLLFIFKRPYDFYHYISVNSLGFDFIDKSLRPPRDFSKKQKEQKNPELIQKNLTTEESNIFTEEQALNSSKIVLENLKVKEDKVIRPIITQKPEGFNITLKLNETLESAIYERGDRLFIFFDKLLKIDTEGIDLTKNIKSIIPNYSTESVLIEIELNEGDIKNIRHDFLEVRATKSPQEVWSIDFLYKNKTEKEKDNKFLRIIANKNFEIAPEVIKKKAQLSIKYLGFELFPRQRSYIVQDKQFNDELIIIPISNFFTVGISNYRRFVNFDILNSIQGLVLKKRGDNFVVNVNKKRVNILEAQEVIQLNKDKEEKLKKLQKELEEKKAKVQKKLFLPSKYINSVLPFKLSENIQPLMELGFMDGLGRLYQDLYQAPTQEREKVRADIIRFMFASGFHEMVLGTINGIKKDNFQEFNLNLELQLIQAASNFLLGKFEKSTAQFEDLLKQVDNEEIKFWLWASKYKLNSKNPNSNVEKISSDLFISKLKSFFDDYPKEIKEEFGLMFINQEIKSKEVSKALKILDILDPVSDKNKNYVNYLRAITLVEKSKIDSKNSDAEMDEALRILNKLTKDDDRFSKFLANLAIVKTKLEQGSITIQEAMDILESNRILWRGDRYEIENLKLLADLYYNNKDYASSFRILKLVSESFPDTEIAIITSGEVQKKLIELFSENGLIYELPNIKILGLYFDIYNLMPIGINGDKIIQKLVDNFIDMDLFQEAVSLLDHQIKFRAKDLNKGELAFKLAEIYLQEKLPEKALESLELLTEENKNEVLKDKERLIKAKALIDSKKSYDFIKILGNDFRTEADLLRLEMLWKNNDWSNYSNVFESLIKRLGKEAESLDLNNNILYLAFAYYHLNEIENLEKITKNYSNFITEIETRNKVEILAKKIPDITSKNTKESIPIDYYEDFMFEYNYVPNRNWKKIASYLEPKAKEIIESKNKSLNKAQENILLQYLISLNEFQTISETKKIINEISQNNKLEISARNVSSFGILDSRTKKKIQDEKLEEKYNLIDIFSFIEKYKNASAISDLNKGKVDNKK